MAGVLKKVPVSVSEATCPAGWDDAAHAHWLAGRSRAAIDATLLRINGAGPLKPVPLVLQLGYYLFLLGDAASAAQALEAAYAQHPGNLDLLQNLGACLTRSGQYAAAAERLQALLLLSPDHVVALEGLSDCLHKLGRLEEAAAAGTRALVLKDRAVPEPPGAWHLPSESPQRWLAGQARTNVIAFSLWGHQPRYLRGALDNAQAAPALYPGWTVRFYVDATVPQEIQAALTTLGAELVQEPPDQSLRMRLGWRFKVANDPTVGRFLVRDADSLINPREVAAVQAWLTSDRWFHVMRDWWTHCELILAGMWCGVAGVLPDLQARLARYSPRLMETPNVDQWFLRDQVWSYVRRSCLMHDRCFHLPGSLPWPEPDPPGGRHVGQDEFAARPEQQAHRLAAWHTLSSLQLAVRPS